MDKIITVKIDDELDGCRVKSILRERLRLSSGIITELKRTENGIVLNGEEVYVNCVASKGDTLVLKVCDGNSANIVARDIPLEILYEDDDIIAVNKPRSMPTHPSQNHYEDTLANGIMHYFRGQSFTFRAITRLDRDTSGVVLIAKNPVSAKMLGDDMKNKKIRKEYLAVVNGAPEPKNGRICAPIKRVESSVMLRCVSPDGKEAVTEYYTEGSSDGLSLVRLIPLTGRTHQLRVHMSHMGNPIYGDDLYGAPQTDERVRLHCRRISFSLPFSGEETVIEAPMPDDMKFGL